MNHQGHLAGFTGIMLTPRWKLAPHTAPQPNPERRYLPLIDPSQLTDERWDALSSSQVRATELVQVGAIDEAAQVLAIGTWRNPEEELRKLIIQVRCAPSLPYPLHESTAPDEPGKEGAHEGQP